MSFFAKSNLNNQMEKTANIINNGIFSIFTGKKIDDSILEELENLLIGADLGIKVTNEILSEIKKNRYNKNYTIYDIKLIIAESLKKSLIGSEKKLTVNSHNKLSIMIFIGVNGSGKTTVIGKIANIMKNQNKKVLVAACDTFRAGAVEQLEKWTTISNVDLYKSPNSDPASVAFNALDKAKKEDYDILLVDTSGRLQNNVNLMLELDKIVRVLKKNNNNILDEIILVLDAVTGQNAKKQVELFNEKFDITGIILNKMDGTSKGGILVSIVDIFKKPIYAIGVGESINDLQEFNIDNYIKNLLQI